MQNIKRDPYPNSMSVISSHHGASYSIDIFNNGLGSSYPQSYFLKNDHQKKNSSVQNSLVQEPDFERGEDTAMPITYKNSMENTANQPYQLIQGQG